MDSMTNITRILIVEDEIAIAELLRIILMRKGYEVIDIVTTGEEAIESVEVKRPDLILMDILLIGSMDGIDTAQYISNNFFIPIIFTTAHSDEDTIVRAAQTASYGYILKPYSEDNIHVSIEMALSKYRLELEIKKRNEELQNLAAHMESVQEEVRKKIAREIHDYLGQSLTALRIDCSWLQNHSPIDISVNQKQSAKIDSMIKIIDDTLDRVRNICTELRPGILDHLGLQAAVRWLCEELKKRTNIICDVSFEPDDFIIDTDNSVIFFRILQEILTNVVRHAHATLISINLLKTEVELIMSVRDNGVGITLDQLNDPHSFGIIGMRERARYSGGKLHIAGNGSGTEVIFSVPLR
jgi:signal transduction histidine kinase